MARDPEAESDRCMHPVRCYSTQTAALSVTEALIDPAPTETQLAYYRTSAAMLIYRPVWTVPRRPAVPGCAARRGA